MKMTNTQRRNGTVVVAVAVCLVGILAVLALSLDGAFCSNKRRQAQAAADAAALAGASELYKSWFANGAR